MMSKRNLVAHCQKGSSDKLYMFCLREASDGTFTVIGKWGRRGRSNLQQQVKMTGQPESTAVAEQRRLFAAKLKKGYVDIESPDYVGPLTFSSREIADNLEKEPGSKRPRKRPTPPTPAPTAPADAGREFIVECQDNAGMEDKFDAGIEYVAESHDDPNLVWVYDKLGERQECFSERFKEVDGI
jgi:predicted DNA-binding WGR domain protein